MDFLFSTIFVNKPSNALDYFRINHQIVSLKKARRTTPGRTNFVEILNLYNTLSLKLRSKSCFHQNFFESKWKNISEIVEK